MQRAKRLSRIRPSIADELARAKAQLISAGRDVIDLASRDCHVDQPAPFAKEGGDAGRAGFRESVARRFRSLCGVELDPENEVLEIGGIDAGLAHLTWAFVDDGDVALVPALGASIVKANALLAGGEAFEFPIPPENGYLPNLDAVPGDIVSRAKLVFLNYPGDPTGALATPAFFQQAVNFARETGVLIAHDASMAGIVYEGYRAPSILEAEGANEVAVEFRALPAGSAVPGHRIAFAAGSADALRALKSIQSVTGGQIDAEALVAAPSGDTPASDAAIAALQRRRDRLVGGLNRLGWTLQPPKASYYVWIPVPPGHTSAAFSYELLQKADILTVPGIAFGAPGEGFIRLSFGDRDGERIDEAIDRIKRKVSLNW